MDFLKGGLNLDFLTGLLRNRLMLFAIIGIVIIFMMKGAFKRH